MRKEIVVPDQMMPRVDPLDPCPCQFKPVRLKYKKVKVFWEISIGAKVEKDQLICEGEIEKKTIEFLSPYTGTLSEIEAENGTLVGAGDILGYIEE